MVISSFIIETQMERVDQVKRQLTELPGVDVHSVVENVKLIVTLECETLDDSYKIGEKMSKLDGVSHLCLVYTNFEDEVFNPQGSI